MTPANTKLADVAEADDLAAEMAHGVVEEGVADDGRHAGEGGEERPLAQGGGFQRAEPRRRNDEADEPGLQVNGDDVEPERGEVAVLAAEGEIPGEEEHRAEADEVAPEIAAAGKGVACREHEDAADRDRGAEDFGAVDLLPTSECRKNGMAMGARFTMRLACALIVRRAP